MGIRGLVVLVVWAGCFDPRAPSGAPCGADGSCPAGLVCELGRCVPPGTGGDVDASIVDVDAPLSDAAPDAAPCVASCSGADLVCGSDSQTCSLGCSETDGAHCQRIGPSNGLAWTQPSSAMVVLAGPVRIDTMTGEIADLDDGTTIRAPGTGVIAGISFEAVGGIGVFAMRSLAIEMDADVRVRGARPFGLLVDGDVTISGVLDLSGGCTSGAKWCAGAGGFTGGNDGAEAAGCGKGARGNNTSQSSSHAGGGGGAGARESGATGAGGTAGGVACGNAMLVPLGGGSGGGRGGGTDGGDGGGGGGAVQITAAGSITIAAGGVIDAGGAGGQSDQGNAGGGGGGGAGGSILLEAASVSVLGVAAANGGAGGGHTPDAGDGEDATRTTTAARGPSGSWGGGNGGTGTIAPTTGRTANDHGGGGGGAAGRIRVLGATRLLSGIVSPAASEGTPAAM